jgi:hypothetical protein
MRILDWAQVVIDLFFVFALAGVVARLKAVEARPTWTPFEPGVLHVPSDKLPPEFPKDQVPVEPSANMRGDAQGMAAGLNAMLSAGFTRAEAMDMLKFSITQSMQNQRGEQP